MTTITLAAGEQLTVTASAFAGGSVWPFAERPGDTAGVTAIVASGTVTFGPYATIKRFQLDDALTYSAVRVDFNTPAEDTTLIATAKSEAIAAAAAAALLAHVPVVGTVGDVVDVIGAGAPDATAQATLTVNPVGDDNSLIYTAVAYGAGGNAITVEYVDPAAATQSLAVSVVGNAISVSLATDSGSAITSTASDVKAAIVASVPASALVTVADDTGDTNYVGGAGVVTAMASAPMTGGAGVGIGVAGIGSRYTDVTAGKMYVQGGTKAVPAWKIVTSA